MSQGGTPGEGGSRHLPTALFALLCLFGNFYLLVPVVPLVVVNHGYTEGVAGSVASSLLIVTVVVQLLIPRMLRTASARAILSVGLILLGAPSLLHALGESTPSLHFVASGLRGIGFGMSTVTAGVLVVALSRPDRLGRTIGLMGLVATLPAIVAPPAALWIVESAGSTTVLAVATGIGILGALIAVAIDRDAYPRGQSTSSMREVLAIPRNPEYLVVFACGAAVYGSLMTFIPVVFPSSGAVSAPLALLAFGVLRAFSRWTGGRLIDRFGSLAIWIPSIVLMLAGAMAVATRTASGVMVGAGLAGIGFGYLQCVSQYTMFTGGDDRHYGAASSLWNVSFDLGAALGAGALGWVLSSALGAEGLWLIALPLGAALLLIITRIQPIRRNAKVQLES